MIRRFRASNFRCVESADLTFTPGFNLIYGENASGKTSVLEALAYLGRGKSFRGASTGDLVRHGQAEFVLFGEAEGRGGIRKIGVRNSREGLEVRVIEVRDISERKQARGPGRREWGRRGGGPRKGAAPATH